MKHSTSFAIFLIAVCTITTRAGAADVYRCGSSYSQTPCPDGARVDVQDARTAAQKAESDAAIRRDTSTANAMEKARLKEEAKVQAANAKAAAPSKAKKKASQPTASDGSADDANATPPGAKPHKPPPKKKKEPEYFTARGASAEKPRVAASQSK
ncbi:MAG: hypothetical protein HYX43_16960 [Burkholderiales bacterium]|nr:hypothetical protein [Burkholderiales bacterium]